MPPPTDATASGNDASGPPAEDTDNTRARSNISAKTMKKDTIPRENATLSDYDKLVDKCSESLKQLNDSKSKPRKHKGKPVDNPPTDDEKKLLKAQAQEKYLWKTGLVDVCNDCIKKVEAIKDSDSATEIDARDADTIIAKFKELKHAASPKSKEKSLAYELERVSTCYERVMRSYDKSVKEGYSITRYHKAYESLMQWLDDHAETKKDEIEAAGKQIQEHKEQFSDLDRTSRRKNRDERGNDDLVSSPTDKRRKGEAQPATTSGSASGNEDGNEDNDNDKPAYKYAKDMKKDIIPRENPKLSDYDNLADECILLLDQLSTTIVEQNNKDADQYILQGNDGQAKRLRSRLSSRRSDWRKASIAVFTTCIEELQAMKEGDSDEQAVQYDAVIAKYEMLKSKAKRSEAKAKTSEAKAKPKKDKLSMLERLKMSLKKTSSKDKEVTPKEARRQSQAKIRYRTIFEECMPLLEAELKKSSTKDEEEQVRLYRAEYDRLLAEKFKRPQAAAMTAKSMKKAAIPRENATPSHYGKFADECSAYLEQLDNRGAELRKGGDLESDSDAAMNRASYLRAEMLKWKANSLAVLDSCIQELELMKAKNSGDSAYQHDADKAISKLEKPITSVVSTMIMSPATLLTRLDRYFTRIELFRDRDLIAEKNWNHLIRAKRQYRVANESYKPWIYRGMKNLTMQGDIQKLELEIRKHEKQYTDLVSRGGSEKRKVAHRDNLVPAGKKRRNDAESEGAQGAASLSGAEKVNEEESEDDSDEDSEDEDEDGDTGGDVFDEQDEMWAFALSEAIYN